MQQTSLSDEYSSASLSTDSASASPPTANTGEAALPVKSSADGPHNLAAQRADTQHQPTLRSSQEDKGMARAQRYLQQELAAAQHAPRQIVHAPPYLLQVRVCFDSSSCTECLAKHNAPAPQGPVKH